MDVVMNTVFYVPIYCCNNYYLLEEKQQFVQHISSHVDTCTSHINYNVLKKTPFYNTNKLSSSRYLRCKLFINKSKN